MKFFMLSLLPIDRCLGFHVQLTLQRSHPGPNDPDILNLPFQLMQSTQYVIIWKVGIRIDLVGTRQNSR
jgi:hypothetical protein